MTDKNHGIIDAICRKDSPTALRLIEEGVDVNFLEEHDSPSLLMLAVHTELFDVVKALVAAGADLEHEAVDIVVRDDFIGGGSVLMWASNRRLREIFDYLYPLSTADDREEARLNIGNHAIASSRDADRALPEAAAVGDVSMIRTALSGGADVNAKRRSDGNCALHIAVQSNSSEIVGILLAAGAETNLENKQGTVPLRYAARNSGITRNLLAAGADPNYRGSRNCPPLITSGPVDIDAYKLLIDAGADVNSRDALLKHTPLHYAIRAGDYERVKLLIDAGADVLVRDKLNHSLLDLLDAIRKQVTAPFSSVLNEEVSELVKEAYSKAERSSTT